MCNGIKATVQAGFKNVDVEGDKRIIIQVVQGGIKVLWEMQTLLHDITSFLKCCNQVTISYIYQQGNSAADWLAKRVLSLYSTLVWDEIPHRELRCILFEDNQGRSLERRAS